MKKEYNLFHSLIKVPFSNINKMKKKILWVLLGFLAIVLYYNSSFHVKSHSWMYRDEKIRCTGIGEFVDFSSSRGTYIYSWPYIYKKDKHGDNKKMGVVAFCFYDTMWVYSFLEEPDHGLFEYTYHYY